MVGMMTIDREMLEEYPFRGAFYEYRIDKTKPLKEQREEEILLLETECDIQEVGKSKSGGVINASFNVYFPFDKEKGINIKRGNTFKGTMYGMEVNGKVIGVFPTQMGGCVVYLTDIDV